MVRGVSDCLSVRLLVTSVSRAKTDEPIEMLFGLWTRVGPGNHVLDGADHPIGRGTCFGEELSREDEQTLRRASESGDDVSAVTNNDVFAVSNGEAPRTCAVVMATRDAATLSRIFKVFEVYRILFYFKYLLLVSLILQSIKRLVSYVTGLIN